MNTAELIHEVTLVFRAPKALKEGLDALAAKRGTTRSIVVREALEKLVRESTPATP